MLFPIALVNFPKIERFSDYSKKLFRNPVFQTLPQLIEINIWSDIASASFRLW